MKNNIWKWIFFSFSFRTSFPVWSASKRIWHTTNCCVASWLFKYLAPHEWMRFDTHSFGPWWHSNSFPSASKLFARPNGTKVKLIYLLNVKYSRPISAINFRLSGHNPMENSSIVIDFNWFNSNRYLRNRF